MTLCYCLKPVFMVYMIMDFKKHLLLNFLWRNSHEWGSMGFIAWWLVVTVAGGCGMGLDIFSGCA